MKSVVLFKEEAEEYRAALKAIGCEVNFIETLQYELVNQAELRAALEEGAFDGVVVTSVRAVEAVAKAGGGGRVGEVWALGGATARAVRERLGAQPSGGDAASGAQLGERVAAALGGCGRVLWPRGQRADMSLAAALQARGLAVRTLTAYESLEHAALQTRLVALQTAPPAAAAYFSPSGAHLALQHAAWLRAVPSFAIGATTAAALRSLGVAVPPAAVAAVPHAAALADSVARYFHTADAAAPQQTRS